LTMSDKVATPDELRAQVEALTKERDEAIDLSARTMAVLKLDEAAAKARRERSEKAEAQVEALTAQVERLTEVLLECACPECGADLNLENPHGHDDGCTFLRDIDAALSPSPAPAAPTDAQVEGCARWLGREWSDGNGDWDELDDATQEAWRAVARAVLAKYAPPQPPAAKAEEPRTCSNCSHAIQPFGCDCTVPCVVVQSFTVLTKWTNEPEPPAPVERMCENCGHDGGSHGIGSVCFDYCHGATANQSAWTPKAEEPGR